jgi:beta-galactosidase/beta-glucuronidase
VRFEHPTNWVVNFLRFEGRGADVSISVPGVEPWTAEARRVARPHRDDHRRRRNRGRRRTLKVGFRRVEIRGPELLVNGRAVLIKGVNRHDHDPRRGKAVTRESIETDVVLMKRHNLNAIRTSHYPNDRVSLRRV